MQKKKKNSAMTNHCLFQEVPPQQWLEQTSHLCALSFTTTLPSLPPSLSFCLSLWPWAAHELTRVNQTPGLLFFYERKRMWRLSLSPSLSVSLTHETNVQTDTSCKGWGQKQPHGADIHTHQSPRTYTTSFRGENDSLFLPLLYCKRCTSISLRKWQ